MVHNDFDNSDSNKNNDDDNSADAGRPCTAHEHTWFRKYWFRLQPNERNVAGVQKNKVEAKTI